MTTRVAMVTGAGRRRVGRAVADALAAKGYAMAIHYRTAKAEAEDAAAAWRARGVQVEAIQADLTDEQAVKDMVARTLARFGRIDSLATCAGAWSPKKLEDVTAADVRRMFETNALSTFLCAQHVGLAMTRQPEGGSIVTLGDWADARPYVNYATYFPSKGAVTAMTRALAVELGWRNPRVRVNCVLPGPVTLPAELPATERAQAIGGTLARREGSPENVAQAVLHFIENDFVTGACLPVDGGRTIFAPNSIPPD